ncbi:hypothetical protein [uncultured Corynebacterium sp.]|uniref:hypothetical protein n=1 Tax=uncultured Corynebacterium sp. TaxID=159447 RepID=UPI002600B97F|nr:hypothetical protein [uncultured Corynebacterium sp.]
MDISNRISVHAHKWSDGWDLLIDNDNATSVRHLSDAADQVRDYLDTLDPDTDHSGAQIDVIPVDPDADTN